MEEQLLNDYIQMYWGTFKYLDDLIAQPMKVYQVSFEQYLIMRDLSLGHQLEVSEIARQRDVSRAAISRQLKTLLNKGLVMQDRNSTDRRRLPLSLTEKGEEVTAELNQVIAKRFAMWAKRLGEKDARELLRIMARVRTEIIDTAKE
ncbi:MarR family winged helix-turn-helix transcriptional regulator [Enterococcus nangangensis]|uniref:MarR family winged helix-turn-helix transcriptional regulator n=1 Tax=Enterococcus nangangensis TaxID=2559926 RepID=UPI001485485A|nr:MarR family transcriptional regulator [Enterococcus nangangensis]